MEAHRWMVQKKILRGSSIGGKEGSILGQVDFLSE